MGRDPSGLFHHFAKEESPKSEKPKQKAEAPNPQPPKPTYPLPAPSSQETKSSTIEVAADGSSQTASTSTASTTSTAVSAATKPTTSDADIPDRIPATAGAIYKGEDNEWHVQKPPSSRRVHRRWRHPLAEGARALPRRQGVAHKATHRETQGDTANSVQLQGRGRVAKAKREERQAKVKKEMQRAWNGYRAHAWMQTS